MSGGGELLCLGISHKTAPVAVRERLALTTKEAQSLCRELVDTDAIREAVAISTCNRTEIYLVGDPVHAETELLSRLAARADTRPTELTDAMYAPRNCDAARQLYRVVSGLESMIVGEAEIQGQAKRAYEAALEAQTTGPLTNRLFTAALQTGKRVRSETALGEGRASVSSVAVGLAREIASPAHPELTTLNVVLIGAGETSELTAQALAAQGVRTIFVANRHADRARSIADRFGGTVSSLHDLPDRLTEADIVVSSTSSPHPLIGVDELALVMRDRQGAPLLLIDLAVPRDIDPQCAELDGVTLYDIDDLQSVVARNRSVREAERVQAEEVVEDEIQRFARWMGQLDVMPTISALREHGDAIVEQVLAENAGRWESASARDRARIEALAKSVMQRLLHEPTIRLKSVDRDASHGRLQIARELFGLSDGVSETSSDAGDEAGEAEVRPLRRRGAGPAR
ncbi:Glutamyl-tRNA reductase [Baekduia alba]|uniref:glutamyl-tRNA reductase n=1 Tax=Baekduia alba TaxID=2997333 RepID=UPI00233FD4AE|nr:glutamyl-tRNA reductase [Baekduia alba]WCB96986.1 Glutamyl-tRNA reductase [Baekduia alba]